MDFAILFAALMVVLCLLDAAAAAEHGVRLNKQFPPISDDEFLARCPPGTSRSVAPKVRRIVSEQAGVPYGQIYPSTRFVEDLSPD